MIGGVLSLIGGIDAEHQDHRPALAAARPDPAAAWAIAAESGLGAVTLHEVARRVGIRQPSLYGYVSSKLDLYDAMFAPGLRATLARLDAAAPGGTAREQLLQLSRTVLDFVVENPPRQQLLFQRTIPGFEPSPASYALAKRLVDHASACCRRSAPTARPRSTSTPPSSPVSAAQQVANDPGGDRWTRHLETLLGMFLDHFVTPGVDMNPTSQPADRIRAIDHAEAMRLTETENARLLAQLRGLTDDTVAGGDRLHPLDRARRRRPPRRLGAGAGQPGRVRSAR